MTGIVIPDGGTIGSASDTDAISIASDGNVTASKDLTITGKTTLSGDFVPATPLSHRNMIINGAMQVAQRGTSFTGVSSNSGAYPADRWNVYNSASGSAVLTASNSTNAPSNFSNSARVEVTATQDLSSYANAYGQIYYAHEGQDLQQLGFGTSDAKQITLSFWCRTNVPQTYQYNLYNTSSSVQEGHTFTVNASNTWEYKTLTFSADTTNTFSNDNGGALRHLILLYAGSNFSSGSTPTTWTSHAIADRGAGLTDKDAFVATIGNYFEITGVQLELGSVATPFEHKSYGEELLKCQRYYQKIENTGGANTYFGIMQAFSSSAVYGVVKDYVTTMRTAPHTVSSDGTFGAYQAGSGNAGTTTGISSLTATPVSWISTGWGSFSGLSAGNAVVIYWLANAYLTADAEI